MMLEFQTDTNIQANAVVNIVELSDTLYDSTCCLIARKQVEVSQLVLVLINLYNNLQFSSISKHKNSSFYYF